MAGKWSRAQLALIVLLLLCQFYLRVRNPLELPAFVDENYHIGRAEIVYNFDRNPVQFSNGKLLFYYWLGLFFIGGNSALVVGRLAVAVFALINGAMVLAIARALFGSRAALPALLLYVFMPWSVFFERMALADPFAAGIAAITLWQSIRLAQMPRPTAARGALVGLLVALTLLAKLTTTFFLAIPVVAALLLSDIRPAENTRAAYEAWARALWARYGRAWRAGAAVTGAIWGVYIVAMLLSTYLGSQPKFFTSSLVDSTPNPLNLLDNLIATVEAASTLISLPVALLLVALSAVAIRWRPAPGLLAAAWLAVLWLPIVVFGAPVQTRYLAVGLPALAVLAGGGLAALEHHAAHYYAAYPALLPGLRRRWAALALAWIVIGGWLMMFALPFGWKASGNANRLRLSESDSFTYISGPFNGSGTRESLAYLRNWGRRVDGQIPAVGVLLHCGSVRLHVTDEFDWTCFDARNTAGRDQILADVRRWTPLMQAAHNWPFVYLITDIGESVPMRDYPLEWNLVYMSARPQGGKLVSVWRVSNHYFAEEPPNLTRTQAGGGGSYVQSTAYIPSTFGAVSGITAY